MENAAIKWKLTNTANNAKSKQKLMKNNMEERKKK